MPQYYVAAVDKRTCRQIPFSEIECESAIDAQQSLVMLETIDPGVGYIVGYRLSEAELETFAHVCRQCGCQFDRRSRLTSDGSCQHEPIGEPLPDRPSLPLSTPLPPDEQPAPSAEETTAYQTLARECDISSVAKGVRRHEPTQLPMVDTTKLSKVLRLVEGSTT